MSSATTTAVGSLRIGPYVVDPPVALAPMAGVTNVAFRQLCREQGGGLFVCEMITSRALVERHPDTLQMVTFTPDESPRSLQLYGIDPTTVAAAVRMIVDDDLADHIDLNFGCPVPKVTRRGGGAALPYKRRLFAQILDAAVGAAGRIPVTVKMRVGIDEQHHTYLDAARIAADAGVAAISLHARTAAQRYSGQADWAAIARLRDSVPAHIPVLGNGDIFSAADAVAMLEKTACDGVVIGRGCLGRPWLFAELAAALNNQPPPTPPTLGEVATILRRHGHLLSAHMGEHRGIRELRKHVAWYLKGFPVGSDLRRSLGLIDGLARLDELIGQFDPTIECPPDADGPRGRQGSPGRVVLPEGWLDDPEDAAVPHGAELATSGG